MGVTTIGPDLGKHVFQVHGMDAAGAIALKRRLRRDEARTGLAGLKYGFTGLRACAVAHLCARKPRAFGHEVRLMPAQYVKTYVARPPHERRTIPVRGGNRASAAR